MAEGIEEQSVVGTTLDNSYSLRRDYMKTLMAVAVMLSIVMFAGYASPQEKPTGMSAHQVEMDTLVKQLNKSFQEVLDARAAGNSARENASIKAHEKDLNSLRNAAKQHKLLTADYEAICGTPGEKHGAMEMHQRKMKAILYDLVDSWDRLQRLSDFGLEYANSSQEAIQDHKQALKDFNDAVEQHRQEMARMKKCE